MPLSSLVDDTIAGIQGLPWNAIINNLAGVAPDFITLAYATSYLLAVYCLLTAFQFAAEKAKGDRSSGVAALGWVWSLIFAAIFMALPTAISSVSATIFGSSQWNSENPFSYMGTIQNRTSAIGPLLPLLQVIGLFTFIRGTFVLRTVSLYGNYSKGNANVTKGLAMVIAGVCLINMKGLLGVISWATGMRVGVGLF